MGCWEQGLPFGVMLAFWGTCFCCLCQFLVVVECIKQDASSCLFPLVSSEGLFVKRCPFLSLMLFRSRHTVAKTNISRSDFPGMHFSKSASSWLNFPPKKATISSIVWAAAGLAGRAAATRACMCSTECLILGSGGRPRPRFLRWITFNSR